MAPLELARERTRPLRDAPSDVAMLQQSLARLAQVTGRPDVSPGPITGTMNDPTGRAVSTAIDLLASAGMAGLSAVTQISVQTALNISTTNTTAQGVVANHAIELAAAFNAAADQFQAGRVAIPAIISGPPWYTTPFGIGAILLGAAIAWKVLT